MKKKLFTIEIKREDLPKHRVPVVINQHGSVILPKTVYRRKKAKDELRRETKKFF